MLRTLLLGTLLLALPAISQESRGNISGRVLDASGAIVPGAAVKVTNAATNVVTPATTNAQGNYSILYLAPGVYDLSAEHPGFKQHLRTAIELRVDDALTFDITLSPGQINESVTVTAATPLLETSISQGQVVDNKRITELPLSGGNAFTLAHLTSGVTNFGAPNHPELAPAVEVVSNFGVSGTRDHNTEYSLDGAPSMWGRNASFVPPADLIGEFKMETTRFDASGRSPGGSVNVALRSGTNRLHGTLAENHSDQHLQALDFFQRRALYDAASGPPTEAKRKSINPQFIINRFSATLGGPVLLPKVYDGRNRTFWIYGFEGLARPSQEPGNYYHTVPTAAQRTGDFSALLKNGAGYQIYDPATTIPAPGGRFSRLPFAGNIIPKNRLDPTAQGLLQYWPTPNLAGLTNGENNLFSPRPSYNEYFSHTTRLDHNFSERNRMFARYNQAHQLFNSGAIMPTIALGNHRNRYTKGFGLDDVFVIGPQFLANFRYSFTRFIETGSPYALGFDLVGAGFNSKFVSAIDPRGITFPTLNFDAYDSLGGNQPTGAYTNYHTLGTDFTRMQGSHSIKFGAEFRLYRANSNNFNFQTPQIDFSTAWTRGPLDNSAASSIGQDLASYLLGLPTGGKGQVNASFAEQTKYMSGFVQDEWRVSSRITLNAGLRYEFETAPTERYNRSVAGFDFTRGGLTFAGVNGNSRSLWKPDHNNFAPRAGIAIRLPHAAVMRAGYGLYYMTNGVDRINVNQTGFTQTTTLVPSLDNGQTFVATLANPFPSGYTPAVGAAAGLATYNGFAISFFNPERKHGYIQRWSFDLQKQLRGNVLLAASYVGSAGSRLDTTRQWDPVPRQYLSTSPVRDQPVINALTANVANPYYPALIGTDLGGKTVAASQLLRPYPQFNGITSVTQDGYSWYHALQLRAERRLRGGFTIQGNYTWSKFMEATGYLNATDARPEYVISDQDRPRRFVATGIYQLPFGKSWSRVPRYLATGWQVAAVYQAQSGAPLAIGNILYYGDVQSIPLPVSERSTSAWFNTSLFERVTNKQLANNIRIFPSRLANLRGQGVNLWNASIMRVFKVTEGSRLQFKAEWLNATNHSQFGGPNMTATAAAFGSITATNGFPRQIYFALKLIY